MALMSRHFCHDNKCRCSVIVWTVFDATVTMSWQWCRTFKSFDMRHRDTSALVTLLFFGCDFHTQLHHENSCVTALFRNYKHTFTLNKGASRSSKYLRCPGAMGLCIHRIIQICLLWIALLKD
jgi:hypothetical protein